MASRPLGLSAREPVEVIQSLSATMHLPLLELLIGEMVDAVDASEHFDSGWSLVGNFEAICFKPIPDSGAFSTCGIM
jgi:hypothetical protein